MSEISENAAPSKQQEWYHGIDLFSRLTGPIAELTRLQQSLLFAELSQIAYMPPEPALNCVKQIGFSDSHYFDRDGAQAYQFKNEHDCVIVCRGTEPNEWNDVKADANAVAVLAETVGRVHGGFKQEVDDLWPNIEQVRPFDRRLYRSHSRGGPEAAAGDDAGETEPASRPGESDVRAARGESTGPEPLRREEARLF